jgi:hypothetical protein
MFRSRDERLDQFQEQAEGECSFPKTCKINQRAISPNFHIPHIPSPNSPTCSYRAYKYLYMRVVFSSHEASKISREIDWDISVVGTHISLPKTNTQNMPRTSHSISADQSDCLHASTCQWSTNSWWPEKGNNAMQCNATDSGIGSCPSYSSSSISSCEQCNTTHARMRKRKPPLSTTCDQPMFFSSQWNPPSQKYSTLSLSTPQDLRLNSSPCTITFRIGLELSSERRPATYIG